MKVEISEQGFEVVRFEDAFGTPCSLQQSSVIGDAPGAADRPGSSMIWLGTEKDRMHLNLDQVCDLVNQLCHWIASGSFQGRRGPTNEAPADSNLRESPQSADNPHRKGREEWRAKDHRGL